MIPTRLVKGLPSAFVCLSVWPKIIKLAFWLYAKAEHMAGVTLFMELDQNSTRFDRLLLFFFLFFAFGNLCFPC